MLRQEKNEIKFRKFCKGVIITLLTGGFIMIVIGLIEIIIRKCNI